MTEKPLHSNTKYMQRIWYCFDDSHPKVKINENDVFSCLLDNLNKELESVIPKAKEMLADYKREGDEGAAYNKTVKKVIARMEKLQEMLPLDELPLGLCTALMEKVTLKKKAAPENADAADSDVSCSSSDKYPSPETVPSL